MKMQRLRGRQSIELIRSIENQSNRFESSERKIRSPFGSRAETQLTKTDDARANDNSGAPIGGGNTHREGHTVSGRSVCFGFTQQPPGGEESINEIID